MKSNKRRLLSVRIEYEPNRFSENCLAKIYEQLHPPNSGKQSRDEEGTQSKLTLKSKTGDQS